MSGQPAGPRTEADAPGRAQEEPRGGRPHDAASWVAFTASLDRRLRDVARPGRPLRVLEDGSGGDGAGVLRVAQRVLADAARRALRARGVRLVGLDLDVADEVVGAATVAVSAPYGTDVRAAAESARSAVAEVVDDVLGVRCPVDVAVVDVHVDDAPDAPAAVSPPV